MPFRVSSPLSTHPPDTIFSATLSHLVITSTLFPQILGPLLLLPAGHPIYFCHLFPLVTPLSAISKPPNLTPLPIHRLSSSPPPTRSLPLPVTLR